MTGAPIDPGRPTLHYSVEHMSPRDILLLKSLVKLLDHRTEQHWCCDPTQAKLKVRGDEPGQATVSGDTRDAAWPTLVLAHVDQAHPHFLKQPLHPQALESMLNQLGRKILHMLAASATPPVSAVSAPRTGESYRLLRWPPAGLLGTPARLRLATLLSSQPMSLASLEQRSGQPAGECAEFFSALVQAGLLQLASGTEPARTSAAPAAPPPASLGFLARIRSRLGLQFPGTA